MLTFSVQLVRGVRDITAEDRADAAAFPYDEAAEMQSLGALGPHGEEGFSTLERRCSAFPSSFCCICASHIYHPC